MRKRILITGGGGYVGRTLTRALYGDHEVCVLDTLQFGIERFADDELEHFRLAQVDIRDGAALAEEIASFRPDIVVHLAAIHFIPLCECEPTAAEATNVEGTINVLKACPEGCRFVFASSAAVYAPDDKLHDEASSELGPRDIYGFTKLHGEHYVRYFAERRALHAVIVRLFNVAGPGETNPHLLPDIVAQMKAGSNCIRLGNIWPKRDYIHVRDAARGFAAAALEGEIAPAECITVNLGTSRQHSVADILDYLRETSGIHVTVEEDPSRVRAVDRPYLGAAIRLIEERFGWSPRHTVQEAIEALWAEPDFTAALSSKYGLGQEPSA